MVEDIIGPVHTPENLQKSLPHQHAFNMVERPSNKIGTHSNEIERQMQRDVPVKGPGLCWV